MMLCKAAAKMDSHKGQQSHNVMNNFQVVVARQDLL